MARKEYIEREAAETELTYAMCGTGYQGRAIDAVRFIPSADVEEVRHGVWIPYFNEYKGYVTSYNCSLCNRRVTDKEPYCHCGAKMDKEG